MHSMPRSAIYMFAILWTASTSLYDVETIATQFIISYIGTLKVSHSTLSIYFAWSVQLLSIFLNTDKTHTTCVHCILPQTVQKMNARWWLIVHIVHVKIQLRRRISNIYCIFLWDDIVNLTIILLWWTISQLAPKVNWK